MADAETEASFEWDYLHAGRIVYDGRGDHTQTTTTITYKNVGGVVTPVFNVVSNTYALGFSRTNFHPRANLVHLSWPSRGLSWLLTVDRVESEYATQAPQPSLANGAMRSPMVSTEFERTVKVGPARASATIVAPAEARVKSTNFMAWSATASGLMTGLVGGYSAEPAMAFVSMPQNVMRTLDIGEVLFFTVHMANDPVILRMEEN